MELHLCLSTCVQVEKPDLALSGVTRVLDLFAEPHPTPHLAAPTTCQLHSASGFHEQRPAWTPVRSMWIEEGWGSTFCTSPLISSPKNKKASGCRGSVKTPLVHGGVGGGIEQFCTNRRQADQPIPYHVRLEKYRYLK